jgi:hypothetical protein
MSLRAATPPSSSMAPVTTSPKIPPSRTTSRSSLCRPTRQNSTRSKTSGNICVATNSRSPSSTVTTTFSTSPATPGHSSQTTTTASPTSQPDLWLSSIVRAVGIRRG